MTDDFAAQAREILEANGYTFTERITHLTELHQAALRQTTESKNAAYWERNQLVAALSRLYPSWIGYHSDKEWEDDWRTIIYIKIPTIRPKYYGDMRNNYPYETVTEWKQLSWHIHDSDKKYFEHLDPGLEEWDGHTTEEKYQRLALLREEDSV